MKRFEKVVVVALLLCVMVLSNAVYADDGHTDYSYTFSFGWIGHTDYTPSREKFETSPLYLKLIWRDHPDYFIASAVRGNKKELTYTSYEEVSEVGVEYYIHSSAYEDYGQGVTVRIKGRREADSYGFRAGVLWSSDSYGEEW